MEEQVVRDEIRKLIGRKEQRMKELEAEKSLVDKERKPATYHKLREDIGRLDHSIMTLIELEHNLRLCGCPEEAYAGKER